jgi:Methyltransferase FkbM domain
VFGFADVQLANDSAYASLAGVKQGRAIGKRLSVRVTTLDDVWHDPQRPVVSFCKIDVEGAELSVLEGAKELLATCGPALLLEADPGPELEALASWLKPRNYREQQSADSRPWNHLFVRGITRRSPDSSRIRQLTQSPMPPARHRPTSTPFLISRQMLLRSDSDPTPSQFRS